MVGSVFGECYIWPNAFLEVGCSRYANGRYEVMVMSSHTPGNAIMSLVVLP